jgi:hypothetical protein
MKRIGDSIFNFLSAISLLAFIGMMAMSFQTIAIDLARRIGNGHSRYNRQRHPIPIRICAA